MSSSPKPDLSEPSGATLTESAFQALRRDIVLGVLEPGRRLRLADLQTRYAVGASPLREALSRLAAERLVLQEANRGFRVATLARAEFEDVAKLRLDLEPRAFADAVRRGDSGWEEALVVAFHRLRRLGRQAELLAAGRGPGTTAWGNWEACHRGLHQALIDACGSPWTLHFCAQLHDQFDRYRRFARLDPQVEETLAQQHGAMVEAALDRRADEAAAILADHIAITRDMVLAGLG